MERKEKGKKRIEINQDEREQTREEKERGWAFICKKKVLLIKRWEDSFFLCHGFGIQINFGRTYAIPLHAAVCCLQGVFVIAPNYICDGSSGPRPRNLELPTKFVLKSRFFMGSKLKVKCLYEWCFGWEGWCGKIINYKRNIIYMNCGINCFR